MVTVQMAMSNRKGEINLHYYEDENTLAGDIVINGTVN